MLTCAHPWCTCGQRSMVELLQLLKRGLVSICSKLDLLIEVGDLGGLRLAFFQA